MVKMFGGILISLSEIQYWKHFLGMTEIFSGRLTSTKERQCEHIPLLNFRTDGGNSNPGKLIQSRKHSFLIVRRLLPKVNTFKEKQ
jgi:hypothetical protein